MGFNMDDLYDELEHEIDRSEYDSNDDQFECETSMDSLGLSWKDFM